VTRTIATVAVSLLASLSLARESGFVPVTPATDTATQILLVDAQVEDPPVYSGNPVLNLPADGGTVVIQLFMPAAAGLRVFAISLAIQGNPPLTDEFQIVDARTELRPAPEDAAAEGDPIPLTLDAPLGTAAPVRSVMFPLPRAVSPTGHLADLTLQVTGKFDPSLAEAITARVTCHADTPPIRLWQLNGEARLYWR